MSQQLNAIAEVRCNEILRATEDNKSFSPVFILDMLGKIEEGEYLSINQYNAIENICDSWANSK